ncbi:MAG: T9SS type A sorting domain-containing protein [Crocinitomicaceae bacterium]
MQKFNFKNSLLTAFALLSGLVVFSQGVCTQFSYYYADINYPASGGTETDIYSVSLEGENAILTPIVEDLGYAAHIAYNEMNGLIYVVNGNNGAISTLDPSTFALSEAESVSPSVGITVAAFNSEGFLLIGGSGNNGQIYQVDLESYELSDFAEGNDIQGGDITFDDAGSLFLAAKPTGKLYEVIPGFDNDLKGNVNDEVTGMATFEDGSSVIVSSRNNTQFLLYSLDGGVTESGAYNALLNDEPFTLENGDMASGCSERSTSIEGCEDLRTYYIHNAQGAGPVILYAVDFNEMGGANLSVLVDNLGGGSHMGLGKDGFIYIVRHNTGMLTRVNPLNPIVETIGQINVEGENVTSIPAVVVGDDGYVYVGSSSTDMIYKVNPTTADAEVFGEGNVGGGDLVFVGDDLWLANRSQGRFYEINGEGQFDVDAEEINGVSVLPDGNLLIANGNLNGLFEVYEPGTGDATGEVFETGLALFNGDLATRCFDGQPVFQDCDDFQTYYIHTPLGGGDVILYGVELTDLGTANVTALRTLDGDSHLGLGENGLLYIVRVNTGVMTILDLETDTEAQVQINVDGNNVTGIPAVVAGDDGFVYVGSGNTIYKVDATTGDAEVFGSQNISGGDLVFTGGALWYANRSNSTFYEINGEGQFTVAAAEINGVSALPNGDLLIANGDLGSTFEVYEPITGNATGMEFETGLELYWGDLASRCFDDNNETGECENYQLFLAANADQGGDIYRVTLGEGTVSLELLIENLGRPHIAYDESNGLMYIIQGPTGEVAIYDPVADIQTTFTNISMGGMNITDTYSATVRNDGTLLVGSNLDGAVYEVDPTTGMASNPIDVDVDGGDIIQTNDGDVWVINRGQGRFYNITDGTTEFDVDLDGIYGAAVMESGMILVGDGGNQLRVVDPAVPGLTETVYELDFSITAGDLAGGCGDNYEGMEEPTANSPELVVAEGASSFTAYPNPTEGISNIQLVAGSSERAVLEIFDMSGRSVVTLLNQDVQEGNTYRLTFDGTLLPNGIYVVKYVTQSETAIEKIMIAR